MICICLYNTLTHRYIYICHIILYYVILYYVMLYYIIILYIYIISMHIHAHRHSNVYKKTYIYIYTCPQHNHWWPLRNLQDPDAFTDATVVLAATLPLFFIPGKREAPFCSGARCFACRGFTGFMGFGMGEWWDTLWLWLTVRHGKIHPFYSYVNHLFLWAMASMAM